MALTEAELDAKRARAGHLRSEIRSLRTEGTAARFDSERENTARELDEEITRLEREVMTETISAGGSTGDALRAMERAAELENMLKPPAQDDEPEGDVKVIDDTAVEPDVQTPVNTVVPPSRPPLDTDNKSDETENGGSR